LSLGVSRSPKVASRGSPATTKSTATSSAGHLLGTGRGGAGGPHLPRLRHARPGRRSSGSSRSTTGTART